MERAVSLLPGVLLVSGTLVAILFLVRMKAGRHADFVIRHGPGGRVEVRGKVPQSKVPGIRAFFLEDLGVEVSGRIQGTFGPQRLLRLEFRGGLNSTQQQRARNFLMEHLR